MADTEQIFGSCTRLDELGQHAQRVATQVEIYERVEEVTPYTGVFLQECERMNMLLFELKRSLVELDLGLKGDLSISEPMEILINALYEDRVPDGWAKVDWTSGAAGVVSPI